MLTHRLRIQALGLSSLALLVAIVVLAIFDAAPELSARLEGSLGVCVLGFLDAVSAKKRLVEVADEDERAEAVFARDHVRERKSHP